MGVQIVKLLGSAVDVNVNINPAGAYNAGTTYNTGDVVEYNGSSYIAKQGTTGNLPTDTTYWQLLAEKGDTGATGATGDTGPAGVDGTGWTGGSYDAGTGVVTFTSDDALGFSTGDLRGADGADGLGVPAGGTTGQILSKVSATDNDTTWSDAPSGTLDGLTDTTLTSPADGEVLQYDSDTSKWVNATASGGGQMLYDIVVDAGGNGDYTTLTAALASISTDGVSIFLRPGAYSESALSTSYNNISIHGAGQASAKITLTANSTVSGANFEMRDCFINTNTYLFTISGSNSLITNCNIEHSRSNAYSLYVTGLYGEISSSFIKSNNSNSRLFMGRGRLVGNHIIYGGSSSFGAITIEGGVVANNYLYWQAIGGSGVIINAAGTSPADISGNVVMAAGGVSFATTATNTTVNVSSNSISGVKNLFTGSGVGNYSFVSNTCEITSPTNAVSYTGTGSCTIDGNAIYNGGSTGTVIYTDGSAAQCTITNNNIRFATLGAGLGVNSLAPQAIINGNYIKSAGTGITIGAGSTNSIVTSNINSNCTTAITDSGTTTTLANNVT